MKLLILSAVVLAGISISFDHPTTRTDGEALPNNEIAGFEMYIDGVKHPALIPNSTSSVDYPTISGGNFKMKTVDTDGRVSAFSEEIFKGVTTTTTTQVSSTTTTTLPPTPGLDIDPAKWSVLYASSYELENWHMPPTCAYNRNAPCGNSPIWHSRYSPTEAQPPHELWLFLGGDTYALTGFRQKPRPSGGNAVAADYSFQISMNGVNWTQVAGGTFPSGTATHTVTFPAVDARYIRFVCLTEQDGGNQCSVDELYLTGTITSSIIMPPNKPTQMRLQ